MILGTGVTINGAELCLYAATIAAVCVFGVEVLTILSGIYVRYGGLLWCGVHWTRSATAAAAAAAYGGCSVWFVQRDQHFRAHTVA